MWNSMPTSFGTTRGALRQKWLEEQGAGQLTGVGMSWL